MNPWIAGALIAFTALTAAEGFLLLGRVRQFLEYAQQINGANQQLLARVPSKSAQRDDDTPTGPVDLGESYGRHAAKPKSVARARRSTAA